MTKKEAESEKRTEWLAQRQRAITATDAGAILGVSKYATPMDVYRAKIGEGGVDVDTPRLIAGRRMQKPIIDWWADRKNVDVAHVDEFTFQRAPGTPIIGASLDAYRLDNGAPIDAKNIGWKTAEWGDEDTDKIPLTYAVQLAVQMFVTKTSTAFLPVLFGGHDLVGYVLERDEDLESSIVGQCANFWWNHVEQRVPPPVDGTSGWTDYLKEKFTKHSDVVLRATIEQSEVAAMLAVATEQSKAAELEVDRLKNILKLAIGDAYALEGPAFRAVWSASKDSLGTDWEQVAKDVALELAALSGKPATHMIADLVKKNQIVTRKGSRRFTISHRS